MDTLNIRGHSIPSEYLSGNKEFQSQFVYVRERERDKDRDRDRETEMDLTLFKFALMCCG